MFPRRRIPSQRNGKGSRRGRRAAPGRGRPGGRGRDPPPGPPSAPAPGPTAPRPDSVCVLRRTQSAPPFRDAFPESLDVSLASLSLSQALRRNCVTGTHSGSTCVGGVGAGGASVVVRVGAGRVPCAGDGREGPARTRRDTPTRSPHSSQVVGPGPGRCPVREKVEGFRSQRVDDGLGSG